MHPHVSLTMTLTMLEDNVLSMQDLVIVLWEPANAKKKTKKEIKKTMKK